jgi:two-component system response regulator PilR (NtrC family)
VADLLIVDDELSMREFLHVFFTKDGHVVRTAASVPQAQKFCLESTPDLVLTDLRLPEQSGMDLLRWLRQECPDTQIIMMTAFASTETAIEAMRLGAYDYQIKPFKVEELRVVTEKALEKLTLIKTNKNLTEQLQGQFSLSKLKSKSAKMAEIIDLIERIAPTQVNVLIEGESGTGKELVARTIHEHSKQSDSPFIALNCAALPEHLIESELFGHEAGSFTGATGAKQGLFEAAHGGTLLLDEIGEMPLNIQAKLLRVLQEKKIRRIGEQVEKDVDVRIVAATNKQLKNLVSENLFREDLYYRLNVVKIQLPPLRERPEDIPLLAEIFLDRYSKQMQCEGKTFSPQALAVLMEYDFPGNVRELQNCIERSIALSTTDELTLKELPEEISRNDNDSTNRLLVLHSENFSLENRLNELEKYFISQAIERSGGVKTRAAKLLGITFRTLRYRLQKLDLE